MNRLAFCLLCLLSAEGAFAIGLGDLNRQPALGERLALEINLNGASAEAMHASCYRLKQPSGGDEIPWIKSATISLRKGPQAVLEIRSNQIINEPILGLAVHVACGQEVVREYLILASPPREQPVAQVAPVAPVSLPVTEVVAPNPVPVASKPRSSSKQASVNVAEKNSSSEPRLSRSATLLRPAKQSAAKTDRLLLSGAGDVGEPFLRFESEIASLNDRVAKISEAQREVLRLEFRMLAALHEQALTQLEMNEKQRNLDKALLDLQQNAQPAVKNEPAPVVAVPPPVSAVPAVVVQEEPSFLEEWAMQIVLLLAAAGVTSWLGWRKFEERRARSQVAEAEYPAYREYTPLRSTATLAPESLTEDLSPAVTTAMDPLMQVDLHLDGDAQMPVDVSLADEPAAMGRVDVVEVEDVFEANPVMELADIMLSFGRVKGAAQALREYIDANPKEALQPWMRLLEVYRMAGMRAEFEELALSLNKNFNVEIQYWEKPAEGTLVGDIDFVLDEVATETVAQSVKAEHLEEMPRIMQQITEHWAAGNVGELIHQLLRDNRGGARQGFSLGVVEEMLFLIELKETIARMEREAASA